ncbi:hypothetical protein WR25_03616 isoform C [Diploscapter pachys]|uniref:Uncharacterized protein n=1 Tax=Diploscapter pachys TaxID=2018661 RepID=A0A2A2J1P8_9BILA|nr:hypothetical protein WR25_03616 isoform A [Diploscapter pachys]PAV55686.1 hypothetical protein WR25_03616 isoform B [Diploscapter pachys]PAV55687.1 hypothetical protein WR25_03616 isoform C [Diploscapter pachys]
MPSPSVAFSAVEKNQPTAIIVEQGVPNDQTEPVSGPSVSRNFKTSFIETMISLLMWFWYFSQLISPILLLTMAYPSWSSIICNLAAILLTA